MYIRIMESYLCQIARLLRLCMNYQYIYASRYVLCFILYYRYTNCSTRDFNYRSGTDEGEWTSFLFLSIIQLFEFPVDTYV